MAANRLGIVARRVAGALPSLAGVVVVTFALTRALPGDPAVYFAGVMADAESIAATRARLGLDRSWVEQFLAYVERLAAGDWGVSLSTGRPVLTELAERLPASLELTLIALIFAIGVAVPLGVLAATRPNSWVDHLCRVIVTAGVSLPTFFTGLFLVYVFCSPSSPSPRPMSRASTRWTRRWRATERPSSPRSRSWRCPP